MRRRNREHGFAVLTLLVCLTTLLGVAGLVVDVARMYIAKNEAQTYADSASLAATLELDGSWEGLDRARAQASLNTNRWNFATTAFTGSQTFFAKSETGPWDTSVSDPRGYRYARVIASAPVPLTFLSMFAEGGQIGPGGPVAFLQLMPRYVNVRGDSAAGQEPKDRFSEGLFPFSPLAHHQTGPHFGLQLGQKYTLRWSANPRLNANVCPGDNKESILTLAEAGGGSERGFIEESSADNIRAAIEQDYQTVWRGIGDQVHMTGGAKQTQLSSLLNRINQDTDTTSDDFAEYLANKRGNGRRLVGAPVNTGYPNYRVVQIGAFLLLPGSEYDNGGNRPFCAEYVGAWVQGSRSRGVDESGAFIARLVR
jgi:hypothetical protein